MEVAQVLGERSQWDRYLPVLANVLRPSTEAGSVIEMPVPDSDAISESITAFRNSTDGQSLQAWGDRLINMVFDGYTSWASYVATQPDWVLTCLAQVLEDSSQQADLLRHLGQIVNALPEARGECLASLKNDLEQWMSQWEHNASAELAGDEEVGSQERVQAYPNTDSWNYSRTPGTYYYRYVERGGRYVYVYQDHDAVPDDDWHELYHWDTEAERLALQNGDLRAHGWPEVWKGWYIVPVPAAFQHLYEGEWVYGKGTDGPWMSRPQAERQIEQAQRQAAQHAPAPQATNTAAAMTQLAREVRAAIAPLAEDFMATLPPEMADNPQARSIVEQGFLKKAAGILATGEAHVER